MGKASRRRREKIRPILEARATEGLVKRARLYDCVRRFSQSNYAEFINDGVDAVIDGQNVHQYLESTYDNYVFWDDLKEVRPPFSSIFVEWYDESIGEHPRVGVALLFFPNGDDQDEGDIIDWSGNAIVYCDWDITDPSPIVPIWETQIWFSLPFHGIAFEHNPNDAYIVNYSDAWIALDVPKWISTAFWVINFINCRNVELIDLAPSPDDSAAYERKFGVPMTKYKMLRINPIGKRYEREDKPQQQFDIIPLHIRRGNFAHYTDEAPLFGKYTGTFWRPATTVGSAKNGTVVKDYKVIAPSDVNA